MKKDQLLPRLMMVVHHGPQYIKSRENTKKTKGILNVLGVYDHTNDKMFIHCYKKRNGDQFLDFIRRVDRKNMIPLSSK